MRIAVLLLLAPVIRAAVLAIDYGAEFTKLSLVKPGVPFDVVLDKDSKRKIQSVVGWKRDERVFGQEGKMTATRFPESHYPYIKPLLAASTIPGLPLYPAPPTIVNDTLIFPHSNPPSYLAPPPAWSPTALLAHQISYFRSLAESLNPAGSPKEAISQVIVTVPAWWTQAQRRAYRDALDLQGLSCLAMIGEGTGVALNYAMTRTFSTEEYHIVYDSGAMQTTATVVAFYQSSYLPTPKSKTLINTTHIEILGTGWEEVGGVMLDLAIREQLVAMFKKSSGLDVTSDARAMGKLSREATRVKHILSANQDSAINIESLYDDLDLRGRLSRLALEESIGPLLPRFTSPITSALVAANLTLADISDVILFGGNSRVPLIHNAVSELGAPIAQNVNTDEAAVLGAAYYGASLSRLFKMKNIDVIERTVHEITSGGSVIFERGAKLGERRSLTFPATPGLTVEFAQAGLPILSVQIVDIQAALANFTSSNPVVNLTMRLDPRGHLAAANAVLVSGSKAGVADTLKGLFVKQKEAEDEIEDTSSKLALRFREKHLVKHMSGEEKRITQSRLTSIAAFEAAKVAREEARNLLEGYLYRLASLLSPETENRALYEFATDAERAELSKLLKETFEWLGEEAEHADEVTLKSKRKALESLENPIIVRFQEFRTRPKAIEDFQQAMFNARAFFVEAQQNRTNALEAVAKSTPEYPVAPPKFTEAELVVVEEMLKDNEAWMDGLMTVQVTLEDDKTKDPVIFSKDLDERGRKLQATVLRLVNKKSPKAPRPVSKKPQSVVNEEDEETSGTTEGTTEGAPIDAEPADGEPEIPVHEEL